MPVSDKRDAINARLDAIFATVRRCSKDDFRRRIQAIDELLESGKNREVLEAVNRMDLLIESLKSFSTRSNGRVYEIARAQLLSAWRELMRGECQRACIHLKSAAECCHEMD